MDAKSILAGHPLFSAIPAARMGALIASQKTCRFKAGTYVWRSGERVQKICVVVEGLLQASMPLHSGRHSTVELFNRGDAVGCLTYLRKAGALCDLRAVVNSVIACFPSTLAFESEPPESKWAISVARSIALRFEKQIRLRAISFEPSRRKVPAILLWLHESTGSTIPLTQAVLATIAGLSEETVCRTLSLLKDKGLVAVSRGVVRIPNPSALERFVENH